jgi:hypothetical protein
MGIVKLKRRGAENATENNVSSASGDRRVGRVVSLKFLSSQTREKESAHVIRKAFRR